MRPKRIGTAAVLIAVLTAGLVTLPVVAAPAAIAAIPPSHGAPNLAVTPADFESGYR
jgi:hypothetical protein